MSNYAYVAVDPQGTELRGTIDVPDQNAALRRIKEMGLFPTKLRQADRERSGTATARPRREARRKSQALALPGFRARVKPGTLAIFTRQIATLVEAGMPLLRSLRTLEEQEEHPTLKRT